MTTFSAALPGAVASDDGMARHYGEPLREQRAFYDGAALVDQSNRGVLVVPGADRLDWLHSICSQHLTQLQDGHSTQALVLSPNGHVQQHWWLTELDGQVWIDVEPGTAAEVLAYLTKMRFLKRVEPAQVPFGVLTLIGPRAADVLAAAGVPVPVSVQLAPVVGPQSRSAPSDKRNPVPEAIPPTTGAVKLGEGFVRLAHAGRYDLVLPLLEVAQVAARLVAAGASPAGTWAHDAWRVEARQPRLGFETDHRTLAHEVGWIGSAVHLDKGCYRGQETVARVQNLGRPPRRLVLLHLSGESDELPPQGTPVRADGREVGFLGTAVHHHELGPIALALIKRSLPDGTLLQAGDFTAAID